MTSDDVWKKAPSDKKFGFFPSSVSHLIMYSIGNNFHAGGILPFDRDINIGFRKDYEKSIEITHES